MWILDERPGAAGCEDSRDEVQWRPTQVGVLACCNLLDPVREESCKEMVRGIVNPLELPTGRDGLLGGGRADCGVEAHLRGAQRHDTRDTRDTRDNTQELQASWSKRYQ